MIVLLHTLVIVLLCCWAVMLIVEAIDVLTERMNNGQSNPGDEPEADKSDDFDEDE